MTPSSSRPPAVRVAISVVLALAIAFPPQLFAMGPFERNHPAVDRGIDAYEEGRFEASLSAFEQAKKELPDRAAIEFNRGNALFKLGRIDEARQAYQRAVELDRTGELHQKDYYNLGNAWAALGNTSEAIAAYRRALTLDPTDDLARHNLEVLLRKLPPPPDPADGGTDGGQDGGEDAGSPDAGMDGGTDGGADGGADAGTGPDGGEDGGAPDGGQGDGGQGDGGQGDGGTDGGTGRGDDERRDGGEGEAGGEEDGGSPDDAEAEDVQLEEGDETDAGIGLNPEDAERILDAMRENEKNLQLWRFQQKKKQRRPNAKDW